MAKTNIKCILHIETQLSEDDFKRLLEAAGNGGMYVEMNISATAVVEDVSSAARLNYIDADARIVAISEPKITIE